jgi:hypothetical protein
LDIHARHIAVNGRYTQLLPPTSFQIGDGQLALVRCLQEQATSLALALSGRIEPDDGAVLLDGEGNDAALRDLVAIVDSPGVTEPEPSLPLSAVVAESLSLAGRPANRAAVNDWLFEQHAEQYAKYRFETLPAPLRTRLLVELAIAKHGVKMIILDCPDRHTGDHQTWWTVALRQAQRGLAVVVLCADGAARSLPVDAAKVGQMQQPAPLTVSVDGVHVVEMDQLHPSMGTQYGDLHYGDLNYGEQLYSGDFGYRDQTPQPPDDAPEPESAAEQTTAFASGEHQQLGEHHYSDIDFAEQRPRAEHATDETRDNEITSRLSGDEPAPSEETTTLQRVSDREDS